MLALLLIAACAQAATISEQIDTLLADESLQHGIQGALVKSLETGQVLYERNADIALVPASNMKLLVSAAALDRLGPDFTWKTELRAAGRVNARGVLEGDLVIKGGGDPVVETADLAKLAREVRSRGIVRVAGGVVADESMFDNRRLGWGWSWDDEPYYYSAQISALNANRNVVEVFVYPGKTVGSKAVVHVLPASSRIQIESSAQTGEVGSEKAISVGRKRGRNIITVSGSIPLGHKVEGAEEEITVEEPALYVADLFRTELAKNGVRVNGEARVGRLPAGAQLIAQHESPPLSRVLALLNKPSDNLIAEVMLKTLGAVAKGQGTSSAGAEVEIEFFKRIGMDTRALSIIDGSGLSRLNFVSPRNLVTLLTHMHSHQHAQIFIDSLPVAGVDGTLARRMKGTPAERNVRAKTGYVSWVSSLSGYVTTSSGEPLVFSILMNNHLTRAAPARAVQDKICALLAGME